MICLVLDKGSLRSSSPDFRCMASIIPTTSKISFLNGLKNGVAALPIYENGNGKKYQGVVKTNDYEPLLELMRFFTPFGVKKYNTIQLKNKVWQDSVYYRQDISEMNDLVSNQEVYIGMNIGNYDKGGHKVNLNLTETDKPHVIELDRN